jgi:S1-C subfamily serine protease
MVSALETAVADAIAAAEPSVVAIDRRRGDDPAVTLAVRGRSRRLPGAGNGRISPRVRDFISFDYGSGVVIGEGGRILTAFHVVRGAAQLTVRAPGQQQFDAEVIAADPRSDLAVIAPIEMPGVPSPTLKPLPLGDSTKLRKGSFLVAMGNSFNAARDDGRASASWGILSNVARRLEVDSDDAMIRPIPRLPNYPTLLQLDAKLNLGMSGGAVINLKGELVGLTTMASSPSGFDAMAGYALPMDRIGRRVVETLLQGKEVEYGLLGIVSANGTSQVESVQPNSPADQGDLKAGDQIVAVERQPIADFDDLILAVNAFPPGVPIRLSVRRGENTLEKTLVLSKFPVDGEVIATNRPVAWRGLRVDFLTASSLRIFGPEAIGTSKPGVLIAEVEAGSPAATAGLKKGQIVHKVGDQNVRSPQEFHEAIANLKGPVSLETDRGAVIIK